LEIKDDADDCVSAPLCLFEIIDSRPSKFWVAKKVNNFELLLWPKEFYKDFFHDHLSDGEHSVVQIFRRVVDQLESEFQS
jgi:hypothetical protein